MFSALFKNQNDNPKTLLEFIKTRDLNKFNNQIEKHYGNVDKQEEMLTAILTKANKEEINEIRDGIRSFHDELVKPNSNYRKFAEDLRAAAQTVSSTKKDERVESLLTSISLIITSYFDLAKQEADKIQKLAKEKEDRLAEKEAKRAYEEAERAAVEAEKIRRQAEKVAEKAENAARQAAHSNLLSVLDNESANSQGFKVSMGDFRGDYTKKLRLVLEKDDRSELSALQIAVDGFEARWRNKFKSEEVEIFKENLLNIIRDVRRDKEAAHETEKAGLLGLMAYALSGDKAEDERKEAQRKEEQERQEAAAKQEQQRIAEQKIAEEKAKQEKEKAIEKAAASAPAPVMCLTKAEFDQYLQQPLAALRELAEKYKQQTGSSIKRDRAEEIREKVQYLIDIVSTTKEFNPEKNPYFISLKFYIRDSKARRVLESSWFSKLLNFLFGIKSQGEELLKKGEEIVAKIEHHVQHPSKSAASNTGSTLGEGNKEGLQHRPKSGSIELLNNGSTGLLEEKADAPTKGEDGSLSPAPGHH